MTTGFKPTADPLPSYRRWYHRLAETVQIQWPAIINVSAMENFVMELMECIEIERNELFDLNFHLQRLRQRIASGVAEKEEAVPELQIVALTLEERLDELERARHDLGRLDAIYDVAKIEYTSNLDSLHTEAIFEQYLCLAMKRLVKVHLDVLPEKTKRNRYPLGELID